MKKSLLVVFLFLLGFVVFYLNLPVLQYGFYEIAIIVLVVLFIYFLLSLGIDVDKSGKKFIITSKPSNDSKDSNLAAPKSFKLPFSR